MLYCAANAPCGLHKGICELDTDFGRSYRHTIICLLCTINHCLFLITLYWNGMSTLFISYPLITDPETESVKGIRAGVIFGTKRAVKIKIWIVNVRQLLWINLGKSGLISYASINLFRNIWQKYQHINLISSLDTLAPGFLLTIYIFAARNINRVKVTASWGITAGTPDTW